MEKKNNNELTTQDDNPQNLTIANERQLLLYKLAKARIMLRQCPLEKTGHNSFQNFDYFELRDIMPSIDSILLELLVGADFELGKRRATLTISDMETGYEIVKSMDVPPIQVAKPDDYIKTKGKLQTYCQRYLWIRVLHITEPDMIDAESGSSKPKKTTAKKSAKKVTIPAQGALKLKEVLAYIDQEGANTVDEKRKVVESLKLNKRINQAVFNKVMSDLDKEAEQ